MDCANTGPQQAPAIATTKTTAATGRKGFGRNVIGIYSPTLRASVLIRLEESVPLKVTQIHNVALLALVPHLNVSLVSRMSVRRVGNGCARARNARTRSLFHFIKLPSGSNSRRQLLFTTTAPPA